MGKEALIVGHVLHVITSLHRGGAQRHLLTLMAGQRAAGWSADLAYLKDPYLVDRFQGVARRVIDLRAGATVSPLVIPRLIRLIRAGQYDVIHTHLLKADAYGAVAARLSGAAVLISSKHNDEAVLRRPLVGPVHGWLARLTDRVIVLSDHVGHYMRDQGHVPSERLRRVYYGITPDAGAATAAARAAVRTEFGVPEDAPLLLTVGRLDPQKGHLDLLAALRLVVEALPYVQLIIAGAAQQASAAYEQALRAAAAAPELATRVHWAGHRDDVPALLAACDIVVQPSHWEGFGLVLVEAMVMQRPVVATAVSAIPEVVRDGETGLLVPPHDPHALARALLQLCGDPDRRARLGAAGAARVQSHFTAERMVRETLAVYAEAGAPVAGPNGTNLWTSGVPFGPAMTTSGGRRPRVLQVMEATIGGTKRHLTELSIGLHRAGYQIEVACPPVRSDAFGDTSFVSDVARAGVLVHPIPMRRAVSPGADLLATLRLARLMRRGRYDIVHCHSSKAGVIGRVAARLAGVPHVCYTPHGFSYLIPGSSRRCWLYLAIERVLGRCTDRLVAVSPSEGAEAIRRGIVPADRVAVIENGLDLDELPGPEEWAKVRAEYGWEDDVLVVGTVARQMAQKDPFTWLHAAAAVARTHAKVRFVWVNGGELLAASRRLAQTLGLDQRMTFLPYVPNASRLMAGFDVLMLSSRFEGLSYVVLEGMGLSKPVVATDVLGTRDVIVHGKNGLLAPPGEPQALAARLRAVLDAPDRGAALGARARATIAERFTKERMLARTRALYERLLQCHTAH